jgi:hypothetical protein
MRRWYPYILAFSLLVLFRPLAVPQSPPATQPSASTPSNIKAKQGKLNCTSNGTYANSKGQTVPRPETCSAAPKGATARCRDRSYSFQQEQTGHVLASRRSV